MLYILWDDWQIFITSGTSEQLQQELEYTKAWLSQLVNFKNAIWHFKRTICNKRYSVWRGLHSSNRVSGISPRTIHQSTTSSLSQTIWPRWASRHFFILPIVQILVPVTFGYSLSSEVVLMRYLRRWKRLWQWSLTRSRKRSSMGPSISFWNGTSALHPEEITLKGTRVSCVYYQ